jgi:prepilin-type N-terminal cleavage/methylation domain-containing protein
VNFLPEERRDKMKPHLYTAYNKAGFSLIEVILSTAILALGLTVSVAISHQGLNAGPKSQDSITAYSLARGTIEEYSLWSKCSSNGTFTPADITINNKSYSQSVEISDGPIPAYVNELKSIKATVTQGTKSYTLTTLKSNY